MSVIFLSVDKLNFYPYSLEDETKLDEINWIKLTQFYPCPVNLRHDNHHKFGRIKLVEEFNIEVHCISCKIEIGELKDHPIFQVKLCRDCLVIQKIFATKFYH